MSKRIYTTAGKRKQLVQEALCTVRETREIIDPALLDRVREAIGGALERQQNRNIRPMQLDRVPVDQKKNLSIVLKFLELQPDNKALQQEIRSFLTHH